MGVFQVLFLNMSCLILMHADTQLATDTAPY